MEDIRSSIIQQVIGALFDYLGKPLGGITTYDIRFYLSSRIAATSYIFMPRFSRFVANVRRYA